MIPMHHYPSDGCGKQSSPRSMSSLEKPRPSMQQHVLRRSASTSLHNCGEAVMSELRDVTADEYEETHEEPDRGDTPTQRVTINQMDINALDDMLDEIRARRLTAVKKLEAAAKVKADDV